MSEPTRESAAFDLLPEKRARIVGALDFQTVTALLPIGAAAIERGEAAAIDLAGVTGSDSAGLALLIEWLSVARAVQHPLRYENLPTQLHQLAALSDVEELIAA